MPARHKIWRRVLREASIDWPKVERLTSDRKVWKEKVAERMEHLDRWERQKGHGYRWEQGEERLVRNVVQWEGELICRYEGCGKVCRNKAGLVLHEKRMHRVNKERGRLKCERYWRDFDAEGQRVSHVRSLCIAQDNAKLVLWHYIVTVAHKFQITTRGM